MIRRDGSTIPLAYAVKKLSGYFWRRGAESERSDVGGGRRVDGPPGRGYPPPPLTLRARDGQAEFGRLGLTDLVAETAFA